MGPMLVYVTLLLSPPSLSFDVKRICRTKARLAVKKSVM